MGLFKTIFAYLLFAMLAVGAFLYVLFPGETVKAFIDGRLAGIDPSLSMRAETIRPGLPAAILLEPADLFRDGVQVLHIDRVEVAPVLSTLFNKQKQIRCNAALAGGSIDGKLFLGGGKASSKLRAEAELSAIRLEKIEALSAVDRFTLKGPLSGRLTHDGRRAPYGKGNGLLTAPGLAITLKDPVFGIEEVILDKTEADFSLTGSTLRLKALTFDGPLVEGKVSGRIDIEAPFEMSRLRLNGNLKPKPELFAQLQETLPKGIINPRTLGTRGVNFRIDGTVEDPNVSMR